MPPTTQAWAEEAEERSCWGEEAMLSNMFKAKRFLTETEKKPHALTKKKGTDSQSISKIIVRKSPSHLVLLKEQE